MRVPRRKVAAELVVNEQRWLPVFAERVSVPLPVPVRVGVPSESFPWAWTVSRWYEGRVAADVAPAERGAFARELASFVAELNVPAPADGPVNPVRGVPLSHRSRSVEERLANGRLSRAAELRETWDELVAVPGWAGPALWLHGDLHPANIVVTGDLGIAAVVDFGDVTSGDPATDLAAAWLVFDAAGRAAFRARVDELTAVDADTWARARGWALVMGTALAAHSDDAPRLAGAGRHALDQVLLPD